MQMNATSDEATSQHSAWLEEAREAAEHGDLGHAARIYQQILNLGDVPQRAQAALGLAVALDGHGDLEGARAADRIAIATKDAEYGPRAAYHLALSYERTGDRERAREAWRLIVDFGNAGYLPPAYLALAQLADEDGDVAAAGEWWERAVATGDEEYAPVAAHDYALRLLDLGEAARAERVLAHTLEQVDRRMTSQARARLSVNLGIAHLEQAIAAFGEVLVGGEADPDVAPLAIELLARALPLRGREEAATEVWRRGLSDPGLTEAVRARLHRALDLHEWAALLDGT
jgi:tetratricopeptide (TPR) repeat protein